MNYIGDFKEDATVYIYFTTHQEDGERVAPSSEIYVNNIAIFKNDSDDEVGSFSAPGITVTSPFNSTVGLHLVKIDTSVDPQAGFWATGSEYMVLLRSYAPTQLTIDGKQPTSILATFSIERDSKVLTYLAGYGANDCTIYIRDDDGTIIADVDVIIRADSSSTSAPVASGKTDALGVVQPHPQLDDGTYYVWRQKSSYDFENPQTIVIA